MCVDFDTISRCCMKRSTAQTSCKGKVPNSITRLAFQGAQIAKFEFELTCQNWIIKILCSRIKVNDMSASSDMFTVLLHCAAVCGLKEPHVPNECQRCSVPVSREFCGLLPDLFAVDS